MTQRAASTSVPVCKPMYPPRETWIEVAKQAQATRADNVPPDLDLDTLDPGE